MQNAPAGIEKMILGNKCDLSDLRVVSKERGQLFAGEHNMKFMETSAKGCTNIQEVSIFNFAFLQCVAASIVIFCV